MNEDYKQFIIHGFFRTRTGNWVSLDVIERFSVEKRGAGYTLLAFIKKSLECEAYIVMIFETEDKGQEFLDHLMNYY